MAKNKLEREEAGFEKNSGFSLLVLDTAFLDGAEDVKQAGKDISQYTLEWEKTNGYESVSGSIIEKMRILRSLIAEHHKDISDKNLVHMTEILTMILRQHVSKAAKQASEEIRDGIINVTKDRIRSAIEKL